jgi:hypothetical protein
MVAVAGDGEAASGAEAPVAVGSGADSQRDKNARSGTRDLRTLIAQGVYRFNSAIALRSGASEITSSPSKGLSSSRIRKIALETDSAQAKMSA